MSYTAVLPLAEGSLRGTINAFLAGLLRRGAVSAVLALMTSRSGTVSPALVTDPALLDAADVLAPVLPVNAARVVSAMTRLGAPAGKTAIVLRSCEIRALVELVKLKQASLENLVVIGVDCTGTYSLKDYTRLAKGLTSDAFVRAALSGTDNPDLRLACRMCRYPVPLTADLTIGLFGADLDKGILLEANSPDGETLCDGLDATGGEQRQAALAALHERQQALREQLLAAAREEIGGMANLSAALAACNNCRNCQRACPVCYCRECFFDSPTFDVSGERYLGMARGRGAIKMPADTLLFHLTRMNHMATSCVGCGSCEEACPNGIPVLKLFQVVAERVQKLFDYTPGRNVEDELPLSTFREEELRGKGPR